MASLLGMLTGVGGGIVRDVLVAEIHQVLRSDLYAVAALAGAAIVVMGHQLDFTPTLAAIGCGSLFWPAPDCDSTPLAIAGRALD